MSNTLAMQATVLRTLVVVLLIVGWGIACWLVVKVTSRRGK